MAKVAKGNLDLLDKLITETPEYIDTYVDYSLELLETVNLIMADKNIKPKDIAEKLGKTAPEISRWLNGANNFTFKTVAKLQYALGEKLMEIKKHKKPQVEEENSPTSYYRMKVIHPQRPSSTAPIAHTVVSKKVLFYAEAN